MVRSLLAKTSSRYLQRHPWQTWLTLAGIALGVAVVVAVDLANSSAQRAFARSLEMVSGRATHHIVGGPQGIKETFYTALRSEHGIRHSVPLVSGNLVIQQRRYRLLGVDPFAEGQLRPSAIDLSQPQQRALLITPNQVIVSRQSARDLGVTAGDQLQAVYHARRHQLEVAFLLDDNHPLAAQGLIITDIATAQELLKRVGRLDRIDLMLTSATQQQIEQLLPPGLQLLESERRNQALRQMTDAFHTNLTAMSLLALMVGGLLIYNSLTFMVLQRRSTYGTLRALGCTGRQLASVILLESTFLAILGITVGLVLGIVLGQGLVQLVTRSINDLYYSLEVTRFMLDPLSLLKGLALGLAVSWLAALLPALEAARVAPVSLQQRSGLTRRLRRYLGPLTLAGGTLLISGLVIADRPAAPLYQGFLALALTALGFCLMVPVAVQLLARGLSYLLRRAGLIFRLAVSGITTGLSRTGPAIAALTMAVATTIGVSIMIDSFRTTLGTWLEQSLNSDIYLTVPGTTNGPAESGVPKPLIDAVTKLPGVASVWRNRTTRVETPSGPIRLMAISNNPANQRGFTLQQGDPEQLRGQLFAGAGVLISEPLAFHQRLKPGDRLTLATATGPQTFPVLGVFQDYTSSQGLIIIAETLYRRHWQDDAVSALGVYMTADANPAQLLVQLQELTLAYDDANAETAGAPVEVIASGTLRARSLAIFDRTFTITQVLRLVAILVAFIGILSALMALQLERAKEMAMLRASGATTQQITRLIQLQTGIMGAFAGLLAVPLGCLMSWQLIEVINHRSFGWSMAHIISWRILGEGVLLAFAAALLAGVYPARKAADMPIAQTMREE